VKHVVVAGLILGGMVLSLPAHARAVIDPAADEFKLLDEEHMLPWDDLGGDELAQQTTPAPATPTPPAAPATTTPPAAPPAAPVAPATPPAVTPPPAPAPPATEPATPEEADPAMPTQDGAAEDDFSIGDIPIVETLELTPEKARKALDVYILVREKYKDAALEDFENLQDFVDQSPVGKSFETDVKAAGFTDVTEWNTTITTLSFAYENSIDDQTVDIKQQITELQADTEMAEDMRNRMITALNAMIPSDNNKKVVEGLKAESAYAEKLKLLETEGE
jgi:hypothetical protein